MVQRADDAPVDRTRHPASELSDELVAYDEQLRQGYVPELSDVTIDAGEVDPETSSLIGCLHLLERAWPRGGGTDIPPTPQQIGRFQLERLLGVGGFGIVYKAYDPSLRREVALKIPRLHSLTSQLLRERFEKEALAAASLDHPNIVAIYETGQVGAVSYIAAAYCSGPNLAEWLKSQKSAVPVSVAVPLVSKMAQAVHYSHARGILHRDLKPSNVLLVSDQTASQELVPGQFPYVPKLTDFGLAKALEPKLTESNADTMALGTPAYMAPEQSGQTGMPIGPATDVYGLGVILYELLTGRTPFLASSVADLFEQIRNDEPVPPRRLRREISRDLETICLRCLEKNPARRFPTARELSDDLERAFRGAPIASRPVAWYGRFFRWCRQKPALAGLLLVTITALFEIVGFLVAHNRSLTEYNDHIRKLNADYAQVANDARASQWVAEENEQRAKDALYAADIGRAVTAWKEKDTPSVVELLEHHIPISEELDRRGFEWWYLYPRADRARKELLSVGSATYILCPSSNGNFMATAGFDAIVRIFDSRTGEIQKEIETGQVEVNGAAFSSDGTELATAGDDGTVRVWNLDSGVERLKFRAHSKKAFNVIFVPDSRDLVTCGDDPVIRIFDADTGQETRQLTGHQKDVQFIALSDDGKTLTSSSTDRTVKRWDVKNWSLSSSMQCNQASGAIASREDFDLMVVATDLGHLQSFRISTSSEIATVKDLDRTESMAIHPDGTLLATGNRAGRIRFWDLDPEGGFSKSDIAPWQAHRGSVSSLIWSKDGSQLISSGTDGCVFSWDRAILESPNPRRVTFPRTSQFCLIPGADLICVTQNRADDPTTIFYNWRTESEVARYNDCGFHEIVASRDGRFLVGLRKHLNPQEVLLYSIPLALTGSDNWQPMSRYSAPGDLANVRIAPDSTSVAVSRWHRTSPDVPEEHFVWLLNIPTCQQRGMIPIPFSKLAQFSPNSKLLAIGKRGSLALWDQEHQLIQWDVPQTDLNEIVFSPDGKLVVTGGDDRLIVVRNAVNGTERFRLAGHRERIWSLAFSPDGRTLASSDASGVVKLWSVAVGQELLEIENHGSLVQKMEFSADARHLLMWNTYSDTRNDALKILDAYDERR